MVAETLTRIAEFTIDGITQGLVLALLGLGITIVFGLGGVLNLSIGVFAFLGVIVALELLGITGNLLVSAVLAVAIVTLFGLVVDKSLLSLVYRSEGEERILLGIFVTLGLAIFLDGLLFISYPSSYSLSFGIPSTTIAGVQIRGSSIGIILISTVILTALYLFFSRTYLGGATRTVMQDETGAVLCGISPRKMRTFVFALSVAIAAIAGILYSTTQSVYAATGFELTILALIVSIVGGVTSIVGAVVAGLALGIIATFTSAYVGAYVAEIALFAVAVIALLLQPEEIA
ncbi:branched-chain amino acid ABC transporter permease [Natrarchaeobaculum aegyptiacum]|uniref:Branched-chain amino acid ABC transporter permease n=1 Tax=Natrarchaeobaculum aegyptiacum TaxID=745377 RepID=A0A2Z2HXT8_9EURY|nr:branched-chain amino acid ABC transporter permease [Natrarchaeobaculum aegyptiacum]ARS91085.1 branched-chain amino acid ABC transporter permease [Natrarchaeobaculum aegyptiacum]